MNTWINARDFSDYMVKRWFRRKSHRKARWKKKMNRIFKKLGA